MYAESFCNASADAGRSLSVTNAAIDLIASCRDCHFDAEANQKEVRLGGGEGIE